MRQPTVPLLLVDGHHLLYRSYFGFPARITSRDQSRDLTGLFGFLAMLRKAHREYAADHQLVVVFDGEYGRSERTAVDPSYKANRVDADQTAIESLPAVKDGLAYAQVPWVEVETAEGDDVIATLTRIALEHDRAVTVMSGDRDYYQLLEPGRVRVLNTAMPDRFVDLAAVHRRFGVYPAQWVDYRSLTGDPSDNVPGVPGIGPKTAARLLSGGVSLEAASTPAMLTERLNPWLRTRLIAQWEDVLRWRELLRMNSKVDLTAPGEAGATPTLPPPARIVEHLGLW